MNMKELVKWLREREKEADDLGDTFGSFDENQIAAYAAGSAFGEVADYIEGRLSGL